MVAVSMTVRCFSRAERFSISEEPLDDFEHMLKRARAAGVRSMIITGGRLEESKEALNVAKSHSRS